MPRALSALLFVLPATVAVFGPVFGPGGGARAETVNHPQRYAECMAEVQRNPEAAFEKGLIWQDFGGGPAAEHCIGAALFALERYEQAAVRLETLAQTAVIETPLKARLLAQAARAWFLLGHLDRADDVVSAAVKLTPRAAALYVDRAEYAAAAERFGAAIDDLDHALTLNPMNPDALAFRAAALRRTGQPGHALNDAEAALSSAPAHTAALLERGMLLRLKGDDAAARRDWLRVLELTPEGPAAAIARRNLELMDVNVEGE
ncbi:MAG: tetratricopeptide repeat protein [Rhodospirillales bacterium]